MQIVFHVGVHATDNDRLIKTLQDNAPVMAAHHVEVPPPARYRNVLGQALNSLQGASASREMQEMMLDSFMDSDEAKRVVLSQPGFIGLPYRAISRDGLYSTIGERVLALSQLFPDSEVEFFIATKNPATLLNWVIPNLPNKTYEQAMGGIDPRIMRWSPVIRRLVEAAQGRRVVVWAHEDAALIWPRVLRRLGNLPENTRIKGELAALADLLPTEALDALRPILRDPELSHDARLSAIEAALAEHSSGATLDEEITLPGWTQTLVDDITAYYLADISEIAAMPGVEFIAP